MAYEFKKLSDVEVIAEPTESANVLIEEDGVIKKAPKTAVGGAGGSETPDMVIGLTNTSSISTSMSSSDFTIISGTFDNVKNKVLAGEMPNIVVRHEYVYGSSTFLTTFKAHKCAFEDSSLYINVQLSSYDYDEYNAVICVRQNSGIDYIRIRQYAYAS